MRRMGASVAGVTLAVLMCACGHGRSAAKGPPARVPTDFAPSTLGKGRYSASEDDKSRKAFTTLGPRALVADGRLWAIRVGNSDKLVATLQVSTMKLKVDLANTKERNAIVNNIIPGQREKIEVGTVSVVQSTTEDTTTYVWFGHDLFEVLQLKRSQKDPVDAEAILTEIVGYQTARPDWKGLPGVDDGSDATGVG